jgi:hypothetical protein
MPGSFGKAWPLQRLLRRTRQSFMGSANDQVAQNRRRPCQHVQARLRAVNAAACGERMLALVEKSRVAILIGVADRDEWSTAGRI